MVSINLNLAWVQPFFEEFLMQILLWNSDKYIILHMTCIHSTQMVSQYNLVEFSFTPFWEKKDAAVHNPSYGPHFMVFY